MSKGDPVDFNDLELSQDTKLLLKELTKRKKKLDGIKQRNSLLAIVNGALVLLLLYWLVQIGSKSYSNAMDYLTFFTKGPTLVIVLITATLFMYAKDLNAKYKKQKQKYEDLRKETNDVLYAHWEQNPRSNKKDEISLRLSSKGINIRYKS